MWKSRKTLATPIFTASTPLWKKDVEKNRFYTDFLFPHYSFSFSLANVEKIRSMAVVDIGLDLLHRLGKGWLLFHLFLHLLDGVEDGGVVPVVEDLADVIQGEVCHGADQVHGNLAGLYRVPDALLSADNGFLQTVIFADVFQNGFGRGDVLVTALQHVLNSPGNGLLIGIIA